MPPQEHDANYDAGVQDGRLAALERRSDIHDVKADNHERRLQALERIVAGMLAIVCFTSVIPELLELLGAFAKQQ
jgi:hypothetical protein